MDAAKSLRGGKLEQVRSSDDNRSVSVTAGRTVVFRVDCSNQEPILHVEAVEQAIDGDPIFEDGTGRKIVRVQQTADRVSLHLADGEIFHVLAVVNEDGLRVATREEREHGRGASSLLDRVLSRFR